MSKAATAWRPSAQRPAASSALLQGVEQGQACVVVDAEDAVVIVCGREVRPVVEVMALLPVVRGEAFLLIVDIVIHDLDELIDGDCGVRGRRLDQAVTALGAAVKVDAEVVDKVRRVGVKAQEPDAHVEVGGDEAVVHEQAAEVVEAKLELIRVVGIEGAELADFAGQQNAAECVGSAQHGREAAFNVKVGAGNASCEGAVVVDQDLNAKVGQARGRRQRCDKAGRAVGVAEGDAMGRVHGQELRGRVIGGRAVRVVIAQGLLEREVEKGGREHHADFQGLDESDVALGQVRRAGPAGPPQKGL